ncbi:MAG TPA: hypothetical protein VHK70_08270, partial [Burkholderiaceae bacterium]|nr:hypothetical protein [Burkholderiaceae bacterium]
SVFTHSVVFFALFKIPLSVVVQYVGDSRRRRSAPARSRTSRKLTGGDTPVISASAWREDDTGAKESTPVMDLEKRPVYGGALSP